MSTIPTPRSTKLDRPVDARRDHILGNADAEITLVEYGSYACPQCKAVHDVVAGLRRRFGDRMRYVFRHFPMAGRDDPLRAAKLAEYAYQLTGRFWSVHDALQERGWKFSTEDAEQVAGEFGVPPVDDTQAAAYQAAELRVQEDIQSAERSGALVSPTLFINDRRYEGPWDESTLADEMLGSLGHRIQTAALDFVRWAPSAGFLLLLMSVIAVALSNSRVGPSFEALWNVMLGVQVGSRDFSLSLLNWVNHGLLSLFFLVVGLEIKREFTVGHLATLQKAALPVVAAFGGIVLPAIIYLLIVPAGPWRAGWGIPIATDTAFAVALIVLLGDRVSVELRVFLTAAVIIDDLVAIAIIALFYSENIDLFFLMGSVGVTGLLVALNRLGVYRPLPYIILGIILWFSLHEAGVHATLAGVILALVTPTRPPANMRALVAQAGIVIRAEMNNAGETGIERGISEPTMRTLDAIHERVESPADKLLRSMEPWSSYCVLPIFALANAGVAWSAEVLEGRSRLILALIAGLVVGKPVGIVAAARLATVLGFATKPDAYSWRQLCGAGALAGIGFTMSLFIAGEAFPDADDFAAAKIAIFLASFIAGGLGVLILLPRVPGQREPDAIERESGRT